MGVNLYIDIPEWDQFANGGMKEIFSNGVDFPKIYLLEDENGFNFDFRPVNFEIWRASIIKLNCNVEMWMKGLDFLEANVGEYVQSSY